MTSQAYAQRERIRTAASADRLLVPTRSLPDTMDIPRPFAPALPDHVHDLLRLCQGNEATAGASAQAGEAAADIDRAGAQLIIEATGRNSGTHAPGDPHAVSPPHQPASGYQLEAPEAEP